MNSCIMMNLTKSKHSLYHQSNNYRTAAARVLCGQPGRTRGLCLPSRSWGGCSTTSSRLPESTSGNWPPVLLSSSLIHKHSGRSSSKPNHFTNILVDQPLKLQYLFRPGLYFLSQIHPPRKWSVELYPYLHLWMHNILELSCMVNCKSRENKSNSANASQVYQINY